MQWVADSRGEEVKRAQGEIAELSKRLTTEVQARAEALRQLDEERHKALTLQSELARAQSEATHAKVRAVLRICICWWKQGSGFRI